MVYNKISVNCRNYPADVAAAAFHLRVILRPRRTQCNKL